MYAMSELSQLMVSGEASELHPRVGVPPVIRTHGVLQRIEGAVMQAKDCQELMRSITFEDCIQQMRENGGADFWVCLRRDGPVSCQRLQEKGQLWHGLEANPTQVPHLGADLISIYKSLGGGWETMEQPSPLALAKQ
jgi:twitching motility protein PilT